MRTYPLALAALVAISTTAQAQGGRVVDVGSFTVTVNGRTVGRETFRITAVTRGDQTVFLATSEITFGDRTIEPRLTTDATGAALDYEVRVRGGGAEEAWKGGITRGRLVATIVRPGGTAAREQMVPVGTVILDEDVVLQHWALGMGPRERRVPVLVPRRNNALSTWTTSPAGEDRLRVGTEDVAANRLRVTSATGEVRDLWLDRSGRLLRVSIPSRSFLAVRDDPPAAP